MTKDGFKTICSNEYPKIVEMIKTVKALGVEKVSCDVYADGHINFDILTKDKAFFSYHASSSKKKDFTVYCADVDASPKRSLVNFDWSNSSGNYDSDPDDEDGVEDDIPVQ